MIPIIVGLVLFAFLGVPLFGAAALALFLSLPEGTWASPAVVMFGEKFVEMPTRVNAVTLGGNVTAPPEWIASQLGQHDLNVLLHVRFERRHHVLAVGREALRLAILTDLRQVGLVRGQSQLLDRDQREAIATDELLEQQRPAGLALLLAEAQQLRVFG